MCKCHTIACRTCALSQRLSGFISTPMSPFRPLLLSLPLLVSVAACADPADETTPAADVESIDSELQGAACRSVSGPMAPATP